MDDFFVFFGDGCEEASLTRRLPLFLSSYYLVSLLSASLMFLAKFKIAKKFHAFHCQNGNIRGKDAQSPQPNWKSVGLRPPN